MHFSKKVQRTKRKMNAHEKKNIEIKINNGRESPLPKTCRFATSPSPQRKVKSVGSDPNQVPRPELDYVTNARS